MGFAKINLCGESSGCNGSGCGSAMHLSLFAAKGRFWIVARKMQTSTAYARESWKNTKDLKGPGIPVPPGPFRVGCADLAHELPEDKRGSLLLRLYYPTSVEPGTFSYADWYPNKRYIQGFFEFEKKKFDPVVFTKITCKFILVCHRRRV